jgi:GNAT superfamily N-acetyltransferase
MKISKDVTLGDMRSFFGGAFPDYHPEEYIKSRVGSGYIFVAKNDEKVEAISIYSIWWGNCPFIELIKVNEAYQRQGIGTKLLETAKSEISSNGFKQLISSTEVINKMGLEFHTKHEFEPLNSLDLPHGEEKFYKLELI